MATREATWAYRGTHEEAFARTYFRRFGNCLVSSIGAGTYLGAPTREVDERYHDALVHAFERGINHVDTAINYRHQRAERVVGRALAAAEVDREAIFVSTKGGFLPFDEERPADPARYVREEYVEPGTVSVDDLARGSHCIAPAFVDDQLDRSRSNLDLDTIDCYYVHNPETQLHVRSRERVYEQLESAFTRLEERAASGDVRYYGVATWEALRVPRDHERYLSLPEILSRARSAANEAGNAATHLRAIQLPFNVRMADAFTVDAHESATGVTSALAFAREADLDVVASASLAQGALSREVPAHVSEQLTGETDAQRAINFARSGPGITTALVGMSSVAHVDENVAAGGFEPMGARAFDRIFE